MNKTPKLRFKEFTDNLRNHKFKELVLLQRGSSPRPINKYMTNSDMGVNWIKIGDVSKDSTVIYKTKEKITLEGAQKSRFVEKGELILSNSMSFGRPYIMGIDGCIHDGWFVLRNYSNNFNRDYLCYLLTSQAIQNQYRRLAAGGVVDNISSELVNSVQVNLPSIQEQEKIASFFSLIDKKISLQSEKVEMLKEYKKGMMQKIFSRELRFKDDSGSYYTEWEEKKLGNYIVEYKEKTTENNQYPVLTSSRDGIVLQTDYFKDRQVTTDDNIGYHIIPRGYITYRSRSDDATFKFNQNNIIDMGIVSYFYPVFCFNNGLNDVYALEYMNNYLGNQIRKEIVGTSQLVLSLNKLKELKIQVPCIEEQNKIGNVLRLIDARIEKQQEKLDSLNEYKKGLLQQMFI